MELLKRSRVSELVARGLVIIICLGVYAWANDQLAQYQGLGQLALISEREQKKYDTYRWAKNGAIVIGGTFLLLFVYSLGMFMSEQSKKKD